MKSLYLVGGLRALTGYLRTAAVGKSDGGGTRDDVDPDPVSSSSSISSKFVPTAGGRLALDGVLSVD